MAIERAKLSDEEIIRESERLLGIGLPEPVPGVGEQYATGDPELQEARNAALDRAIERELDDESSAKEREHELEIQQLREDHARLQKVVDDIVQRDKANSEREYSKTQEGKERLRVARYRRIRANGGFCTVQLATSDNPDQNWPVEFAVQDVWISIPRGSPVRIPLAHLEALDHAEVDAWIKKVDEETGLPKQVHVQIERIGHVVLDETGLYPGATEALRGHVL